ncbi:hypothetical protein Tco_0796206 [Tanacetum coccineum]
MVEHSQKWHNWTSRGRSTETSDGIAAIQAQLNNLGREIKKVNEKFMAVKKLTTRNLVDLFKEGDIEQQLQGTIKGTTNKLRTKIRATTDAAIRNQGASIKTLEIQIGQMSKSYPTGNNSLYCCTSQGRMLVPFPSRSDNHYCEEEEGNYGPKYMEAYETSHINDTIPQKEKDLGRAFMNVPIFVGTFSVVIKLVVFEDMDAYRVKEMAVASRGWSFASAVLGPMTHLIASTTLASANSGVMQGASFVVVAIVGVVVVVVGSSVSSIIKLLFVIVDSFSCYWSSACPDVLVNICHVSSLCFQSSSKLSAPMLPNGHPDRITSEVDLTGDEDLTDEDGYIGMGDSTGVSASLGGEILLGGKKSWESNIGGGIGNHLLSCDHLKNEIGKGDEVDNDLIGFKVASIENIGVMRLNQKWL